MNIRAGICEDCGEYFTVTGGGLNEHGQCHRCEEKFPVVHCGGAQTPILPNRRGHIVEGMAGNLRDDGVALAEMLHKDGTHLGAC